MLYSIFNPSGELRDIISHYWVGTWDPVSSSKNNLYYVIGSSSTDIVFGFSGPEKTDQLLFSVVQGHTQSPMQATVPGYHHLIGISLYSYAIPLLFKLPSFELNRKFIPLTTFLGKDGHILNEKIALAKTTGQRIQILNSHFYGLLRNQKIDDARMIKTIETVIKHNGNRKIIELANESFLSPKQFKRRFKEFSGFTPKTFAKIIRFETALWNHPNSSNLTDLALMSGYYDQAHYIHDFKEFTGFNPREFWKLSTV